MVEVAKEQLKKLEAARDNLARQIENSEKALAELDDKISRLKMEITDLEKASGKQSP